MTHRPVVHMAVVGVVVGGQNEFIVPCIRSFLETTRDAPFTVRVTAIDNSPGSGLGAQLRREFPEIEVFENRVPLGYAANQNAALFGSDADYLLVANDDIVFRLGAVARAVAYLEDSANPRVGVVGFQNLNPDGSLQPSTYSFPTVPRALLHLAGLRDWIPFARWTAVLARLVGKKAGQSRFWAHDRTVPVDTFRGSVMLARARAAQEVGPMDEVSLVGGEETEWHRRFWKQGWKVVFLHDAAVLHYGSRTIRRVPALQTEFLKGVLNYFWKHRSRPVYYSFCAAAMPILAVRSVFSRMIGRTEDAAVLRSSLQVVAAWLAGASEGAKSPSDGGA